MNNRSSRSGSRARTPEAFVVDLTTVCLRSGTVRLPLSMIGRFSEGQHKVTAGGEELVIEFEAPRTLTGLGPFFERSELRANDRVRFEFDGQVLALTAQKRERPRGAQSAAAGTNSAAFSPTAPAEAARPQSRNDARIIGRGLFPSPAELVDVPAGQQRTPEPVEPSTPDDKQGDADGWHDSSVTAVRRVRIEGGLPPRADTAPPRPVDRTSARDLWARRQQAPWRSLDTMVAGPVVPPEEAADAFSESTIRVVRRSKGTSTPLEVEAPPLPKLKTDAPSEAKAPMSYSMSWPLPETPRSKPPVRAADGPPSRHDDDRRWSASEALRHGEPPAEAVAAHARAQLDPYLDSPIDAEREADYAPPTILESDLLSLPTGGKWRTESEKAYLKYQEAQVAAAAEPVAVPAERRPGLLGRLGLGRGSRGHSNDAQAAATPARREPPPTEPVAAPTPVPEHEPEPEVELAPDPMPAANNAPADQRADMRVIVDESVYDVDFDTEVQPHLLLPDAGEYSLESDMARLRQYLHQPEVPAIVRCEDLAARLQISQQRVSSAMLRLAEDRERYTPLRGDAYMVRRAR